MITQNAVYNYIHGKVIAEYTNAYVTGVYEPIPSSFPAVFIREIGNLHNPANVTFSGVQGVRTSTFEVQIQTNTLSGMKSIANGILSVVTDAFADLHYILESTNVIDEGDSGIYRLRASYRRIIGLADSIS